MWKNNRKVCVMAQKGYVMSDELTNKLRKIYDILFSVLLIVTGIALAAACIQIYRSGDRPFSPESISQHFHANSLLIYGTVIGIFFSFLLDIVLPRKKNAPKAVIHEDVRLARQLRKGAPTGSYAEHANKEHKLRRRYGLLTVLVFILLMIYPAVYFSDLAHFTVVSLNRDVTVSLAVVLIPGIIGLGLCLLCSQLWSKSYLRELSVCKEAIKSGSVSTDGQKPRRGLPVGILRVIISIVAIVFIVAGIFNGGASDVLLKAIAICTECIGLG